jgi:hypothetical protein
MKLVSTLMFIVALASIQGLAPAAESTNTKPAKTQMTIKIGPSTFTATLEENPTVAAFKAMLPMTIKMTELNGNEKYYRMGRELPSKAAAPGKIQNGDLMLYGADTLVLFYKSFPTTYSYTRLGRIDDPAGLAAAIGSGDVMVTYELK